MDALKFLQKSSKTQPAPLFMLVGEENFLRRRVIQKLTADLLGDADPSFALSEFEGDKAEWSTVKSELDTLPFLSPRRVVVIDQADTFVSEKRKLLEDYVAAQPGSGVLILDVKSFPSNTKLYKAIPEAQVIQCKSPSGTPLVGWCREWANEKYGKELASDAAQWLVQLVGDSMGQLDSELDKLATFVGAKSKIVRGDVEQMVGRTREAETFKIFDAIGNGNVAAAMTIFQRLMEQGEDPMAVLGAFSWQLRRLAAVSRSVRSGMSMGDAMTRVGVPPFARSGVEQQLHHLGRARMDRVYDWLLETDLGMKGSSPLSPRLLMEKLVVKLARKEPGTAVRR